MFANTIIGRLMSRWQPSEEKETEPIQIKAQPQGMLDEDFRWIDEPDVTFADAVKIRRKQLGLSVQELVKRTGLDRSTVYGCETGRRHNATADTLYKLEDGLSCERGQLYRKIVGDLQRRQTMRYIEEEMECDE